MPIPTTLESLSTTPASNGPAGTDQRTTADDGLRQSYAFIKQLVSEGSDIASATTITPPSTASVFNITGTTAITTIASTNSWDGRVIYLIFAGALTFTHGANLDLPGAASITTAAGDVAVMLQTGTGAWKCIHYQRDTKNYADFDDSGSYTPTLTGVANIAASTAFSSTYYQRLGDIIYVAGQIDIDPTAASTLTTLRISLVGSGNFASIRQLSGQAVRTAASGLGQLSGAIVADTTNEEASLSFINDTDVANRSWTFWFMYSRA